MRSEFLTIFNKNYLRAIIYLTRVALTKQYRATFMGMAWMIIQPSVYILILSFSFAIIMRIPGKDYPLYIVSSFMPWGLLTGCLTNGANALISRESIFKRSMLSKSMFVISDVLMATYTFVLSFVIMYLIVSVFIVHSFHGSIVFFPLMIIPLLITSISGAIMFAYIAPYVRDVGLLLGILFQALFWATPIAYPIDIVPADKRFLFEYNPFYILLHPIQSVVYRGTTPSAKEMLLAFLVSTLVTIAAFITYRLLRRNVIYYL